jgi:hypothetical protein
MHNADLAPVSRKLAGVFLCGPGRSISVLLSEAGIVEEIILSRAFGMRPLPPNKHGPSGCHKDGPAERAR